MTEYPQNEYGLIIWLSVVPAVVKWVYTMSVPRLKQSMKEKEDVDIAA